MAVEMADIQPGKTARKRVDHFEAVRFGFTSPSPAMNLLLGALCILSTSIVPVVGQLVWMGYVFDAIETVYRDPRRRCPDFTFDRFTDYMVRGLWLFLAALAGLVVLVPAMAIFLIVVLAISGLMAGAVDGGEVVMAIGMVFAGLGSILLYLLGIMLLMPFLLRAGLSQDIKETFDMQFARDFFAKVWRELLVAEIFSFVFALVAIFAGLMLCFVGVYPASALVFFVQAHLLLQLYEIYLQRGGKPIPLKP